MELVILLFVVGTFTYSDSTKCSSSAARPRRNAIAETVEESLKKDSTLTQQGTNTLVSYGLTHSSNVLYNQWLHSDDVPSLPVVKGMFGYAAARLVYVPNRSTHEPQPIEMLVVHGGRVSRATYRVYDDLETEVSDQIQFFMFTLNTGVEVPISVGSSDGSPGGRYLHTAVSFPTLATGGRPVVFYGGLDKDRQALGSVWHLEVSEKKSEGLHWSSTVEGPRRCGHSSVSLGNNMLVFGGCNQTMCMNDVHVYNVVQHIWVEIKGTGKIPSPRGGHIAIAIEQANLMFIHGGMKMPLARGSHTNYSVFGDTYVLDMNKKVWQLLELTPPTSLTITHAASAFFQYSNYGRWVVYGIVGQSLDNLDKEVLAELTIQLSDGSITSGWDIKNKSHFLQFPKGRIMTTLISFSTSTGDQIAYMIGGAQNVKSLHHHFYDPFTEVWLLRQRDGLAKSEWIYVCAISEHPEPRAGYTVTALGSGSIALFGGVVKKVSSGTTFADGSVWQVFIENRTVQSWKKTIPSSRLVSGVVGHSSVSVVLSSIWSNDTEVTGANAILTFGGFYWETESLENRLIIAAPNLLYWYVWSPSKNQPCPCPRAFHSLIIYNSTLYLFGGLSDLSSLNLSALNDTWSLRWSESWTESANIDQNWTPIVANESSPRKRFGHSAVIYYNDSIGEAVMLVFGGTDGMMVFGDLWQLGLSTLTWKQLLPYLPGEHAENTIKIIKVFGHSVTMIGNEMVVYGGCSHSPTNNFLSLAESLPYCSHDYVLDTVASYDTLSNKWTLINVIGDTIPRYFHSTLFQNSFLFIFGGLSNNDTLYDGVFAIRLGCNRGYEGSFPNGTCVPCPTGYYGNGGDESCQLCDKRFTTNGTAKSSKSDCSICNDNACKHGKCKLDKDGEFTCECSRFWYRGRYCDDETVMIILAAYLTSIGFAIITIITIIVKKCYKKCTNTTKARSEKLRLVLETFKKAVVYIDNDEIEKKTKIGKGGHGTVYRGMYKNHILVAVKEVNTEEEELFGEKLSKPLVKEWQCLARLNNRNIVKFYGGGGEAKDLTLFLVTELVQPGALTHVLHDTRTDNSNKFTVLLTDRRKMEFCSEIWSALMYLREKRYVHRDLKPDNILVCLTGKIKIADFGIAKNFKKLPGRLLQKILCTSDTCKEEKEPLLQRGSNASSVRIPNCYMAPELVLKKPDFEWADMYRYTQSDDQAL